MKLKVLNVEMNEVGSNWVVIRITQELPETEGEKVNRTPMRTEIYNGPSRAEALQVRAKAREAMYG